MIYKNSVVGGIEGVTLCAFGNGDINVSTGKYVDGSHLLFLANMKHAVNPIGTELLENYGKSIDETGVDVVFEFSKVESVQVVIDALERIKVKMIDGK